MLSYYNMLNTVYDEKLIIWDSGQLKPCSKNSYLSQKTTSTNNNSFKPMLELFCAQRKARNDFTDYSLGCPL